jgi:hypothetical protein
MLLSVFAAKTPKKVFFATTGDMAGVIADARVLPGWIRGAHADSIEVVDEKLMARCREAGIPAERPKGCCKIVLLPGPCLLS